MDQEGTNRSPRSQNQQQKRTTEEQNATYTAGVLNHKARIERYVNVALAVWKRADTQTELSVGESPPLPF